MGSSAAWLMDRPSSEGAPQPRMRPSPRESWEGGPMRPCSRGGDGLGPAWVVNGMRGVQAPAPPAKHASRHPGCSASGKPCRYPRPPCLTSPPSSAMEMREESTAWPATRPSLSTSFTQAMLPLAWGVPLRKQGKMDLRKPGEGAVSNRCSPWLAICAAAAGERGWC